ncbi:hypothetical protein [Telluria aromaticivorans]|uniref:Uncharacterized protein n=1 Tax=Telluria aromaticivorans TaxID=2725995 RepID=A0A7Y2JYB4_9BURK|nr:hypothetical protein [Telluria aromaticivorans]NNG23265.1 hypothetical protein [Telluria aromaticivorans]
MTDPGDAAWPRRRPGWPLAATLGLHLLLAWSWRTAHPPAQDTLEERVFNVIPVPPPAPELASVRRETEPVRTEAPRTLDPALPALPDAVRAAEPITPSAATPAPAADPLAITAAPAESPLDAMVGRARREAGVIDRELRKGKSGVPAVAGTPWGRFTRALDAAHIDNSRTLVSESYTAPDGAIIYRFRQGGRVLCRISGGVKPGIGNAIVPSAFDVQGGNGTAGLISCPSHATWKRD